MCFYSRVYLAPYPRHMILDLGFPKGGGRVSTPRLIVNNNRLMLIGRNTHDTDPTARPVRVMML